MNFVKNNDFDANQMCNKKVNSVYSQTLNFPCRAHKSLSYYSTKIAKMCS